MSLNRSVTNSYQISQNCLGFKIKSHTQRTLTPGQTRMWTSESLVGRGFVLLLLSRNTEDAQAFPRPCPVILPVAVVVGSLSWRSGRRNTQRLWRSLGWQLYSTSWWCVLLESIEWPGPSQLIPLALDSCFSWSIRSAALARGASLPFCPSHASSCDGRK